MSNYPERKDNCGNNHHEFHYWRDELMSAERAIARVAGNFLFAGRADFHSAKSSDS
jgi:hypothetical protein